MVNEQDDTVSLDDVDREILYELQQDARKTTHEEISAKVDVSPSTVRNRISALENAGVIKTYAPELNYERAGFSLRVQFVCTAPMEHRHQAAQDALNVGGVITVQEMVTSEHNLLIEVIATSSQNLTEITRELGELNLTIHTSNIITNTFNQRSIILRTVAPDLRSLRTLRSSRPHLLIRSECIRKLCEFRAIDTIAHNTHRGWLR